MRYSSRPRIHMGLSALMILGAACIGTSAAAAPDYQAIHPTMASTTVTLTGNDLTVDQVVEIARFGAKAQLSPEAKQRNLDTFNLMNEGAAEGVPIYLFNRNGGAGREVARFEGDPMSRKIGRNSRHRFSLHSRAARKAARTAQN